MKEVSDGVIRHLPHLYRFSGSFSVKQPRMSPPASPGGSKKGSVKVKGRGERIKLRNDHALHESGKLDAVCFFS
jgi:hypothetical protein